MDAVIGVLADYTIKPILHQIDYLFRYNINIKEVEKKLESLGTTKDSVQILVSQDKGKGNAIFDGVIKWLDSVENVLDMGQQNEGPNPSCFNLVQRHQLSRKAKKRVENIIELIDEGRQFNKDNVGYPVPSPDTNSPTLPADYQIIKSRTSMAKKIKDALASPNVSKVGVYGMGGVGKTALLNEVKKLVLGNNLFDRVIQVEVGQSKSVIQIQEGIGGKLNVDLSTQCKEVRASRLRTHIAERKENILIMLDDLWKEYDLENDFGIPCHSESMIEGCKILMTSRSQHTLKNQMNIEKLFGVNCLTKEESWEFFVAIIGDQFVEDGYIQEIAKDVVKECGGLPIALKILAKALKGKRVEIWMDAFKRLKDPIFVNIPGVSDQLYSCLQFSYDSIEDEAKLILLLCCVFPDDHWIDVKDLQMYAMGMRLLNGINTWIDARNRVIKLVDDLKSSSLLLESDNKDDYVQMHDVVHDVAKYIASKIHKMPSLTYGSRECEWREEDRCGSYNAIYINGTKFLNLPPKLEFPNLHLFILSGNLRSGIRIPDTFFEGMEELRVLDVRNMCFAPSNWTSLTHSLKNLQTLCLSVNGCSDIGTIGELKKLEILKIRFELRLYVSELPASMSELTQLKVFHVFCFNLKLIHPNIIASMRRLEELVFGCNFISWGDEVAYKNKLIKNAKVSELNCLTHLLHLNSRFQNVDTLSNELSLDRAQNLQEFHIRVGLVNSLTQAIFKTTLELEINSPIDSIGGALQILLQKCEKLVVRDSVGFTKLLCNPNGNYGYPRLKYLQIIVDEQDEDMPLGIENITPHFDLQISFPQLVDLIIVGGNNLELWHNNGLTANSFCKLQRLCINGFNKLTYVFPLHMVTSLKFLNTLEVRRCKLVERIFEVEEQSNGVNQVLPLATLRLNFLPNLKHVWNNDSARELLTFPNLKEVTVEKCRQLKTLFPASFINYMKEIERLYIDGNNEIFANDEALQLVSPEIVLFPSLRNLTMHRKLAKKGSFWVRSELFPKLQTFCLTGSKDDGTVSLPLEMSELVNRVKSIEIRNELELTLMFLNGEENNKDDNREMFTSSILDNYGHVWEDDNNDDQMNRLKNIYVQGYDPFKCLVRSSITFLNLRSFTVINCMGSINLFSSSMVKNLVNLKVMSIIGCGEMISMVIAEEGEEMGEIIFNSLHVLELYRIPRLTSFYSGKCMLKFPCLEKLHINGCSQMKTFSYGIINMPKLKHVEIEEESILVSQAHGINVIIEDTWKDNILKSIKNLFKQHQDDYNREDYTEDEF